MPDPMLELVGVTAGYGRSMVLFDVDLAVPQGGAVAIMGHNGAGKTTLLRVAVGLVPVRSGKILLDGEDVTKSRPNRRARRGLGYVPQGQLCFPQMTTLENLQLVSTVKAEIEQVIVDLTKRGDFSVVLVEQHVGFALRSTDAYYVLESGRITGSGEGGEGALDEVRAAMVV